MRTILTLGALAVFVTLFVVGGRTIPHAHAVASAPSQSATAILTYDEYGNPTVYDDGSLPDPYPDGSYYVYDEPSDYSSYNYTPTSYNYNYGYGQNYGGNSSYSSGNVTYDSWGNAYYNYYMPPSPPPQPWYVQALPGVGNIAQPIVQGVAPQTISYSQPTCSIAASPSVIPYGGSVVIRWASQSSDWSDLTGLGTVDPSGSWQFDDMTRTQTFVLSLSGNGGTGSCSTVVTVQNH